MKPSFLPGVLWFITSTILLTLPGSAFPKENFLESIQFDKWVHIGMFSIMVTTWCWGLLKLNFPNSKLNQFFILTGIVWLLYGIGMEFIQRYCIVNRSFDVGDIIADAVGCIVGVLFSRKRFIKK